LEFHKVSEKWARLNMQTTLWQHIKWWFPCTYSTATNKFTPG